MDTRHQFTHWNRHDPVFSEGGENLLDVAQENPRRTDDQNSRSLQALAVRVEQVRRAV